MPYENYLEHHGILGMKWGVRRYQNYDGTYTQAGMKRYRTSEAAYDHAQKRYKDTKAAYKAGTKTKGDVVNAKIARNTAKRQLKKDYKHLKYDKLGDQGKILYSSGVTITNNREQLKAVGALTVGGQLISNIVLGNSYKTVSVGDYDMPISELASGAILLGGATASALLGAKSHFENKRLRAYYGHTSNY